MRDDEFEQLLAKLADAHRDLISDATRKANEVVQDRMRTRPAQPVEPSVVIHPDPSVWSRALRGFTMELVKMAATITVAVGLTLWLVNFRARHSSQPPYDEGQWIARGITNASASVVAQLFPRGWRRAGLAIGVSRFRDPAIAPLPGASLDVEAWSGLTGETLLIPPQHYVALHDQGATEAGVRSALRWLATFDRAQDQVFIYVATHAETNTTAGLRLKLYDSVSGGGISVDELADIFKNTQAQVVMIADVCQAGDLGQSLQNLKSPICVLASASREQAAFEIAGGRQSVFGETLLKALRGAADTNEDGIVTVREAFLSIKAAMSDRMGGRQTPVLINPNRRELAFAISGSVRDNLPPAGAAAPAPARAQFTLGDTSLYRLTIDGRVLGVARGEVGLTLLPGEHELKVETLTPSFARVAKTEPEMWSGKFVAAPGTPVLLNVLIRPMSITQAQAIGPQGALFPVLVCNPASPLVTGRWQDDRTLDLEFIWSGDAPKKLTALFVSAMPEGVSIPRLFGLAATDSAEVVFDALAEQRDEPVVFFTGGGSGAESLVSPIRLEATVSATAWKHFSIPLPAAGTDRLMGGFGVEVSGGTGRGAVILHIRDVRISKTE